MPKLNPKATRLIRWLAFLPTVAVVALAAFAGAVLLDEALDNILATWGLFTVGAGVAVYLGSRVAPSHKPWPVVSAAALVILPFLYLLRNKRLDTEIVWMGVTL